MGRFRFGAIDQIALAHDSEDLAIGADHRYGADPMAQQQAQRRPERQASGPTVMTFKTITRRPSWRKLPH